MNGPLAEDHNTLRCTVVIIIFLFAVAAGLLLAHLAFGYYGRMESADSPAPPSIAGRVSATARSNTVFDELKRGS
jgi:hypothetical protein